MAAPSTRQNDTVKQRAATPSDFAGCSRHVPRSTKQGPAVTGVRPLGVTPAAFGLWHGNEAQGNKLREGVDRQLPMTVVERNERWRLENDG